MISDKQVSGKQFVILIFVIGIAMKMFMLPAIILRTSGRDSWIAMAGYLAVEMLTLTALMIIIKKCPDMTIYDLMESAFGKIISRIVIGILAVYLILKLTLVISEVKVFFTVSVFENLAWPAYVVPVLALLFAIGLKTLRGIGRMAEIFTPYILLSMVILAVLILPNVEFGRILPILENGPRGVLESLTRYPFWFGDFSIMLIFIGNVKKSKHLMTFSLISGGISAIAVLFFSVVLFSSYGEIPMLLDYGHNISNMTQYTVSSLSYGRFDIIIFTVWVIAVFIEMAVLFYSVTRHMVFVTTYKNNYVHSLILAAVCYAMIVFVFPNENLLYTFITQRMPIVVAVFQVLMPLTVLIVALVKGRKKKPKEALYDKI